MTAASRLPMQRLFFVIPTQGQRSTLHTLLAAVSQAAIPGAEVIVVRNGQHEDDASNLEIPVGTILLSSPQGYSAPRNKGATEAVRRGATGVIFIDDDVEISREQIHEFVAYLHIYPGDVHALWVEKRIPSQAPKFASLVLNGTPATPPQYVSAAFLYLPAKTIESTPFADALNRSGCEDTALSAELRSAGHRLHLHLTKPAYEDFPMHRLSSRLLVGRVATSSAVLAILDKDTAASRWSSSPTNAIDLNVLFSSIGWIAQAKPLAGLLLAKGIGRLLGTLSLVPVLDKNSECPRWRILRISRRATSSVESNG